MTRYEIEDIRDHAERYHLPPHWEHVITLCDIALGRAVAADTPRPVFRPYPGPAPDAA
jgi:hypothetical protein